jgi:hypothetical protein
MPEDHRLLRRPFDHERDPAGGGGAVAAGADDRCERVRAHRFKQCPRVALVVVPGDEHR